MAHGRSPAGTSGLSLAIRTGAALAAAMGVGRFVFTPMLPLMESQAHLAPRDAGLLASVNYLGYLAGALLGIAAPRVSRSRAALRTAGAVLVLSMLVMPMTEDLVAWIVVRAVAGAASAVVFMVAGNALLAAASRHAPHVAGWAYGGVGAGIAGSGALIALVSGVADWRVGWFSAAALTAVLLWIAWPEGGTRDPDHAASASGAGAGPRLSHRWFGVLALSYFFEGAGYIISGTFLVVAVGADGPRWLAAGVWIIVGVACVPSSALWGWLSGHVSRPTLITAALALQAVGIALPAFSSGAPSATASAALLGATFVGITTLSLATGRHLGFPRAVAVLTAGYGVGQVLGPLLVAPALGGGYRVPMGIGAALVLVAAVAAGVLRIRFPHGDQPHHGARRSPARTA